MSKPSLKLVIDHCRRVRDDAVAAQARVEVELRTALRTLQTLEQYRDEQQQRAREARSMAGKNHLSTTQLVLQTRFSDKLVEALALQSRRVADLKHHIENCRTQVLALQQRLKAIETIESQRVDRAYTRAERADQAAADEQAANRHAQRQREDAVTAADISHTPHPND